MGETPQRNPGVGDEIGEDEIARIDSLYSTPTERAERVWAELQKLDLNYSDLLCFCISFCGQMAISFDEEIFTEMVRLMGRRFYDFHYNQPHVLYGPPDKGPIGDAIQQVESGSGEDVALFGGIKNWEEVDKVGSEGRESGETGLPDPGSDLRQPLP